LDRVDSSAVQSKLEELTSKKVRLSFSIDKSLVGGFVAQVGDTVYDGSVRRQLEILRRQLAGN
jgi:F-type H+-transporting ATPase subunit delta